MKKKATRKETAEWMANHEMLTLTEIALILGGFNPADIEVDKDGNPNLSSEKSKIKYKEAREEALAAVNSGELGFTNR